MLSTPIEIDSFLSEDEFEFVWKHFETQNWEFKAGERGINYPVRTFWYKELEHIPEIVSIFKAKIEGIMGVPVVTNRCYANGQAHSQTAFVHTDPAEETGIWGSCVFYLHRNWLPHFGGHLIFVDNNNPHHPRVSKSIFPHTNSAVVFDSRQLHCALEPTVYCLEQRISIAYKFKVVE
jgi:hypothetical protein